MKKIVVAVLATVSGLVLLVSYRTSLGGAAPVPAFGSGEETIATPVAPPNKKAAASASTPPATNGSPSPSTRGLKDGTFTGQQVQTRFGVIGVSITVSGGKITGVSVPEYPSQSPRDEQIASFALPKLVSETLSAQSAQIDMVSGATYTSQGYLRSLQSAIDAASA